MTLLQLAPVLARSSAVEAAACLRHSAGAVALTTMLPEYLILIETSKITAKTKCANAGRDSSANMSTYDFIDFFNTSSDDAYNTSAVQIAGLSNLETWVVVGAGGFLVLVIFFALVGRCCGKKDPEQQQSNKVGRKHSVCLWRGVAHLAVQL